MSLTDRLDELRQMVPGCTLVSFGDISTGLALRTSASQQHKQDYLEDILLQAARSFAMSDLMTEGNDLVVVATEPPPLKWSAPIVRKAEDQEWLSRDPSRKRLS